MQKNDVKRKMLSGNEAIALAARHCGVALGVGYPGTPSTEILENFSELGGSAEWAPNEKVAAEVALGVAFAQSSSLITMKHVGFNVAQDLFFTAAYSGIQGAMVAVVADDPGMASSQNEQDTRSIARCGGLPVIEPADSQEAYDFTKLAFEISRKFGTIVVIRTTTRVAHTTSIVEYSDEAAPLPAADYKKDIPSHVMVPAHAKPAHKVLRKKLAEMQAWNSQEGPNKIEMRGTELGIVASGVAYQYAREAAPDASIFKVGMSPLPIEKIVEFSKKFKRCITVEEGDPYMNEILRAGGANIEERAQAWRFGELNVDRVRAQIANNTSFEMPARKAKPPALCKGCPHIFSFQPLVELGLTVAGDIGCYTLAAMKPLSGMDMQICMGASIGMGVGMRKVLPEEKARKVVSVIGDSTFMHSGLTGLVQALYNPPATGHVIIIVDNSTTAMTGHQENPATGKRLDRSETNKISIEEVSKAMGVKNVAIFNPVREQAQYKAHLQERLGASEISVIILRQPCILAAAAEIKRKAGK
ncbi:MAG: thiamine pyrophosphate-binding protein [Opitutales bacterium]|nr:thiamine pyrophosphate-binding protein [Opitutales bacterium]